MGTLKKKERGVLGPIFSVSIRRKVVVNLVAIPLEHGGAYQSIHFLEQRRRMMMVTTPASSGNKTTKVKRPKEGGFYVKKFGFCFVVGSFFPFTFLSRPKRFLFPRIWLLPTNKRFLPQSERFCYNFGFP